MSKRLSRRSQFSQLVVLLQLEKCKTALPAASRSGRSGQFCVTDALAGVSSQHNTPSHIRAQNTPQEKIKKQSVSLCIYLYVSVCGA